MTKSQTTSDSVLVFVPVGKEATVRHAAAEPQRAKDAPFVIGLLDNHKHNSDAVLERLSARLAEKMEGVSFVRAKKPEAGKGAPKALLDDLATRCDAVVNGIGD